MLVGGGVWSWCGLARSSGGVCSCFGMLQARARGACACVCACVRVRPLGPGPRLMWPLVTLAPPAVP